MRDDAANPGLLQDVAAHAGRHQVLAIDRSAWQTDVGFGSSFHVQDADVVVGLTSRELAPDSQRNRNVVFFGCAFDQADSAAEKRTDIRGVREAGHIEYTGAFEEEWE